MAGGSEIGKTTDSPIHKLYASRRLRAGVAVDNCSKHGSACKSIVWYYNSCAAVAADGNIVTWGRGSAKQKAEQTALAECAKADGKKCAIQVSQCSR
jgi:hypothetical protein